ncbi:MAG: peptidoglycan DD-metalloendopeptidase family protein [Candidatus Dojkabacteria bacterium]
MKRVVFIKQKPPEELQMQKRINASRDVAIKISRNTSSMVSKSKSRLVSKLFWGRSDAYKNISHVVLIFITISIVVFGLFSRIEASANGIDKANNIVGSYDLLEQGGSLQTVAQSNDFGLGVNTQRYTVKTGDTLNSVSTQFGITADTIKWANVKSLSIESILTGKLDEGSVLIIPEINGVLYEVKAGDTIDSIINTASLTNDEANKFNIEQFNNLSAPYALTQGQKLFIPDGNLKSNGIGALADIPVGVFTNPLQDSRCVGYTESRGFLFYHNGIDLAMWPGCPISAIASGIVVYAGWSEFGEGYNVRIDHGGGIVSHYYHGNGDIWVKKGDHVEQGQLIMFMGTTGNSTGVHLHLSLFKDNVAVDPEPYVPF